jgi:hypothetical protein
MQAAGWLTCGRRASGHGLRRRMLG